MTLAGLVISACNDNPTEPAKPKPKEEILNFDINSPITLTKLNETVTVTGSLNGVKTPLTLTLVDESRWTLEREVVSISGQNITARGAGWVRVAAKAQSSMAPSDTITVIVEPIAPYVSDFEGIMALIVD